MKFTHTAQYPDPTGKLPFSLCIMDSVRRILNKYQSGVDERQRTVQRLSSGPLSKRKSLQKGKISLKKKL